MSNQISPERKTAYYIGMGLMILGGILFLSTFVTFALHFGDFTNFNANARSDSLRAFGGIILLIVGGIVSRVGAMGLSGSGVILNPQQARQELEPYTRMAGGMVKDALDEADIHLGQSAPTVIMIKCPACGKLNEKDSKFCQECGTKF